MTGRIGRWLESMRQGFWAVPSACAAVSVLLALGLVQVDQSLGSRYGGSLTFGAGPDGAREVLSAITTSMITFTGLVFSITIVVLQLTSSQFSPRVLRTFLRDRQTQFSLGAFVGTFVYAVLVLRTVKGESAAGSEPFVPGVSTTVGVLLLLVSVGVFVAYIHHIATAIQVSSIIRAIARETRQALDRRFPVHEPGDPPLSDPRLTDPPLVERPWALASALVTSEESGVVVAIDVADLVRRARDAGVVLVLHVRVGDFVPEQGVLLAVHGDPARLDSRAVRRTVAQGGERTMKDDVAFGFRQLVDIAERALSPSVNDPTTAVQVLDELHDLLRRLAARPLDDGRHRDCDGVLRVVAPPERFRDYLALALDEIEHYGDGSLQVPRRVAALLEDLCVAARPENVPEITARLVPSRVGSA